MKWPKIPTNDPVALREFVYFLQRCVEASSHVKGLTIFDDCEENYTLLHKLPDWILRQWSYVITDELDK